MGKVYFPRLVSPAASTISNLISFGIQFAMFLIFLLAQYFGAEYDMVTSMSLAGILMLYDSPLRILESGCIISFTSIFAIGMIVPFAKELEEKLSLIHI